jgi:putative exporter of polyketide antibiotics
VTAFTGVGPLLRFALRRDRVFLPVWIMAIVSLTYALNDAQAILGELDAARVSELLRVDADQAELLLAEASVAALLGQAAQPRLRIEGQSSADQPHEPGAEAGEAETPGKATEV